MNNNDESKKKCVVSEKRCRKGSFNPTALRMHLRKLHQRKSENIGEADTKILHANNEF